MTNHLAARGPRRPGSGPALLLVAIAPGQPPSPTPATGRRPTATRPSRSVRGIDLNAPVRLRTVTEHPRLARAPTICFRLHHTANATVECRTATDAATASHAVPRPRHSSPEPSAT